MRNLILATVLAVMSIVNVAHAWPTSHHVNADLHNGGVEAGDTYTVYTTAKWVAPLRWNRSVMSYTINNVVINEVEDYIDVQATGFMQIDVASFNPNDWRFQERTTPVDFYVRFLRDGSNSNFKLYYLPGKMMRNAPHWDLEEQTAWAFDTELLNRINDSFAAVAIQDFSSAGLQRAVAACGGDCYADSFSFTDRPGYPLVEAIQNFTNMYWNGWSWAKQGEHDPIVEIMNLR